MNYSHTVMMLAAFIERAMMHDFGISCPLVTLSPLSSGGVGLRLGVMGEKTIVDGARIRFLCDSLTDSIKTLIETEGTEGIGLDSNSCTIYAAQPEQIVEVLGLLARRNGLDWEKAAGDESAPLDEADRAQARDLLEEDPDLLMWMDDSVAPYSSVDAFYRAVLANDITAQSGPRSLRDLRHRITTEKQAKKSGIELHPVVH